MMFLKRELTIADFFAFDLNTSQGQADFERIINYNRQQMYNQIPLALDEKFNETDNKNYKYDNYVIEYKKVAWDEKRIYDEIDKYPICSNGKRFFKGVYYRPDYFREKVLSRKPFDLYLYIKEIYEYKDEELKRSLL